MSVPMHEFTASEIFWAFRPFMPEAEAHRIADFLSAPVDMDAILAQPPHNQNGPGLPFWPIPTVNFSRDTLILLSLFSAETAAKVDRYRAQLRDAGAIGRQEEEEWQQRHRELTAWRDAGFPRENEDNGESDTPAT
jgi:hypothetical protein